MVVLTEVHYSVQRMSSSSDGHVPSPRDTKVEQVDLALLFSGRSKPQARRVPEGKAAANVTSSNVL